ncbi:MAG TPA: hypothetical protein VGG74_16100 [Kofleriaceae bacterium]
MASAIAAAIAAGVLAGCGRIGFDPLAGDGARAIDGDATSIAFVQTTPVANVANVGSAAVVFNAPTTAGDLLVLAAWTFAADTSPAPGGFMDGAGNVYQLASSVTTTACETGHGALAIYDTVAAGDQASLQISYAPVGTSTQEIDLIALEYRGVSALDRDASLVTPAGTSPHVFSSGTTPELSADHELLFGAGFSCSGSPGPVTFTDDAGFATRGEENGTENGSPGIVGDKIVDQGGTATDTWTATYGTDNEVELGAIATFR